MSAILDELQHANKLRIGVFTIISIQKVLEYVYIHT